MFGAEVVMKFSSFFGRIALVGAAVAALASTPASACTICGEGWIDYLDWGCVNGDWQLVKVGLGDYPECGPSPTLVWGRRNTQCYAIERIVGGGTEDTGQCSSFRCVT